MQVRRCREEGSETPGIRMSVVSHRKASGTNDLPPIHALPGDEGPVESARSNQVAGISGPESRRLRPLAPHHGRSDVVCPHRTLRVHAEYDSEPKWRVMAKSALTYFGRWTPKRLPRRPDAVGRLQKAIPRSAPIKPLPVIRGGLWLLSWRDRHALSIANPWNNLRKIRHSARCDGRDGRDG